MRIWSPSALVDRSILIFSQNWKRTATLQRADGVAVDLWLGRLIAARWDDIARL
jgi:hypothetical protein